MPEWNGFYNGVTCRKCGKSLDGQGDGHPAESYAGTYTGLCDKCTHAGGFVIRIAESDGCKQWSYPPHCPSWRRDRESYLAYDDCLTCKGTGRIYISRSYPQGGPYYIQCKECSARYYDQPIRKARSEFATRAYTRIRALIESRYYADLRVIIGWRKSKKITARTKFDPTEDQTKRIEEAKKTHFEVYQTLTGKLDKIIDRKFPDVWSTPA